MSGKISQFVIEQDQLKTEHEEKTVCVSHKDSDISLLKDESIKAQVERHGSRVFKELQKQNDELIAKVDAL